MHWKKENSIWDSCNIINHVHFITSSALTTEIARYLSNRPHFLWVYRRDKLKTTWEVGRTPEKLVKLDIIDSKYFAVSDWLQSPGWFFMTNWWLPYLADASNVPSINLVSRHGSQAVYSSTSLDNIFFDLRNFSYPTQPRSIIAKYSLNELVQS